MRLLLVMLITLAAGTAHCAVVGVVLHVQGKGVLVEAGKSGRLDMLVTLPLGAELQLEDNSRATIVLYKGNITYDISGPAAVGIEDGALKPIRGTPPRLKNVSQAQTAVAVEGINRRLAMSAVALRSAGSEQSSLQLLGPSQDVALLSGEPELTWTLAPGALSREVVIQEITGQEIARLPAIGNALMVPKSVGLKPGTEYLWSVSARFPGGRTETRERVFRILPASDTELVRTLRPDNDSDMAAWVLYAAALEKFGASDEARRIWKIVAEKNPDSERAKLIVK